MPIKPPQKVICLKFICQANVFQIWLCMSGVLNPKLTGLTGFMFKLEQKQRSNSANTHKHLCGHTLHAHILKFTEDSLILFWVKHTQSCLAYSPVLLYT